MKNTLNTILGVLLLIANVSIGHSSESKNDASTGFVRDELAEQHTLYHGGGNLIFEKGTIKGPSIKATAFTVIDAKEVIQDEKNYHLITGNYNDWTARRAFYALANEAGNVLWVKSPEESCTSNHSEGFEIQKTRKEDHFLIGVAYLHKSCQWTDSTATAFSVLEVSLEDALHPKLETKTFIDRQWMIDEILESEANGSQRTGLFNREMGEQITMNSAAPVAVSQASGTSPYLELWPNPSTDVLHINLDVEPSEIWICDMKGRVLKQLNPADRLVGISDLAKGSYCLMVNLNGKVHREKFMKL